MDPLLTLQENRRNEVADAAYQTRLAAMSRPSTTFDANALSNGVTPAKIPAITTTTSMAAPIIAGAENSQVEAEAQAAATLKAEQEAAGVGEAQKQKNSLLDIIKGKFGLETDAYKQASTDDKAIDPFRAELANINKEIADQNVALRGEEDRIKGRGDITQEAQNGLMQNLHDTYGRRLADLAIRQAAANTNVTALVAAADRKLALTLAPIENDIKYFKDYALANADDLDKKEQAQLAQIIAEKERIRTQRIDEAKTGTEALKTALANGIKLDDATVQAINTNPAQAYQILASKGISLQNPLDVALKSQQLQKARVETQQALTSLPGPIQTKVQTIAGQFDNEQAVKNYQAIAESIDAVKSAGTSPTDDIQRIYAVAKVLDPSSAVKEGEYKTVEAYAQSLFQRTGKKIQRVFDNAGFLTPEARTFINDTLDNRLKSSEKAYKNIYDEYGRRINKITGRDDGTEYITDYSRAFTAEAPTTTKSGLEFDVAGAKAAGHTDEEIKAYIESH